MPASRSDSSTVQLLLAEGFDTFVAVGPGTALHGLTRSIVGAQDDSPDIAVLSTLDGGRDDATALWHGRPAVGARHDGLPATDGPPRPRSAVPTYPFQRTRHWLPGSDRAGSAGWSVSAYCTAQLAGDRAPGRRGLGFGRHRRLPSDPGPRPVRSAGQAGRKVYACEWARLDEMPPVSVMVLFAGSSAELDNVESLDAATRSLPAPCCGWPVSWRSGPPP